MGALIRFLEVLGTLVRMRNGGEENDVTRLINYARLGARAGDTGKRYLVAAVQKVEQLVAEDRHMTDAELAEIEASIQNKLARAAGVVLPAEQQDPQAPPVVDESAAGSESAANAGGTDPT